MTPMNDTHELQRELSARLNYLLKLRRWDMGQLLIQAQTAAAERGWTISASTLYRYAQGNRQPEAWTVITLAAALQTSTDFLLGTTNDPGPAYGPPLAPAPEVAPLVERLNALPAPRRAPLTAALLALLATLAPDAPTQGQ